MVANRGQQTTSLEETLFSQSYRFEFHQAVKILEVMYPDTVTLGKGAIPEHEALNLKSRILFAYPPSDIYEITQDTPRESSFSHSNINSPISKVTLRVNFFGIAGANGPLPLPYTEQIFQRFKDGDQVSADFLDIFNHRLLSILHRIRRKYWLGLDPSTPEKTRIAEVTYAFLGLGTQHLQNRFSFPNRKLLFYAGLFWQQPRSTEGLKTLLHHYFKHPVEIIPFKGGWEKIESQQQTRLNTADHFNTLGQGAMLGTRVWNAMQKVIIQIGPLTRAQFHSFLPQGDQYEKLYDLIKFYLGLKQKFDINFIIKSAAIEASHLSQHTYLGWSSWLKSHTLHQNDHQVTLRKEYRITYDQDGKRILSSD